MRNLLSLSTLLLICAAHAAPAQSESLLIGPGGLVQVDVLDTPEMEQQVRVSDAGTISLAYVGSVYVAGETPSAAVELHLDAIEKGKQPDIALQSDEIVFVPFSWLKNIAMSSGQIAAGAASAAVYVIP